jgi:hypothetical protein
MPRSVIIAVACAAIAAIAIVVALRNHTDDHAATKPAAHDTSQSADTTPLDPSNANARRASATGSAIAPIPPPEARVDLIDAFTASRFEDVHALCASRETASAHPFECTVAACKTNRAADAQRYFIGVADADRPKVQAECEAASVQVDPEATAHRRVRPHVSHGKRVIDD